MASRQQRPETRSIPASPLVGTATAVLDRQAALRRQLQWRMGVAASLVLLLLAALTLLDPLTTLDDTVADNPQYTKPVAVRKAATKAVEPVAETPLVQTVVATQASGAAIEKAPQAAESQPVSEALPAVADGEASPLTERVLGEWPRVPSGHLLQSGLLPDLRQAEELQARLLREGIPARVETRLQVGPFKTRAEAEVARRKLKALGMEGLIVAGKGSRP